MKKIGFVFECGPQGADKQVCEYLAKQIQPAHTIDSKTLDNKANLLRDAAKVAKQLLASGCCCVLIVWDLRPAWPDKKEKPCRAAERAQILNALLQAGVPATAPVYLVCIEQELESWLVACHTAISACLSTPANQYKVTKVKHPDQKMQPKSDLINHFRKSKGWTYDDKVDAIRVLRATPLSLRDLRKSVSFARFEKKLLACP
jgi:hypothetical protein